MLNFITNVSGILRQRRRLLVISYGFTWIMCKYHNDRIFNQKFLCPNKGGELVQSLVHFWIKSRGSVG